MRKLELKPDEIKGTVILLVDDEPAVLNMLALMLSGEGHDILKASSGEEALRVSREYDGPIDLLLSDLHMPGMTGLDLSLLLTRERPSLKVIIVSGTADLPVPLPFHLVRKPFPIATLRSAIDEVLGTDHAVARRIY